MEARELPGGTVTLLFTDIEGSTRMLQELGREVYVRALTEHRRLLREAFTTHGGVEVEMQGDSFHFAFPYAREAVAAAIAGQQALQDHEWEAHPIKVRIGVHTGEPMQADGLYAGLDVHHAARVMSAGHGGQILLSHRTAELVTGELPEEITLLDLGEHRLKDLTAPQRLYQVDDSDFPPLKTLSQRTNLPIAASSLIGRERELAELTELLRNGARLVTVTGASGTGKTRLALQAAAELVEDFRDGAFWVPLAGLRDPDLVLASVAQTLGAREELAAYLVEREALLVLDNFEHVIAASAPLAELLAAAPDVKALVTSRAPLHVDGEHEFLLDPLAEDEAMTLFVERARSAGRRLEADETVAEICRRLDNLPLALELAAARTKLLGSEALLIRLEKRLPLLTGGRRDAPERQRTLRAAIEWSYELLDVEAKQLFARLSVFAGSFSIDAAEQICDADLDALAALVDLSLLKPIGDDRFLMLETIREYAHEHLGESLEADERQERFANHFAALAEQAAPHLQTHDADVWLNRLEEEHANLSKSIDLLLRADARRAALAAIALHRYWDLRGHLAEGRYVFGRIIPAAEDGGIEGEIVARALIAAAGLAFGAGDYTPALDLYQRSLALARRAGDHDATFRALASLALVSHARGSGDQARTLAAEGLELAQRLGDIHHIALSQMNLGYFALTAGELGEAREFSAPALTAIRALGDAEGEVICLFNIGLIDLAEENLGAAHRSFAGSLSSAQRIGLVFGTASAMLGLAAVAARSVHDTRAAQLLAAVETSLLEIGAAFEPFEEELRRKTLAQVRARLGDEDFSDAWALGQARFPEEMAAYAVSVD